MVPRHVEIWDLARPRWLACGQYSWVFRTSASDPGSWAGVLEMEQVSSVLQDVVQSLCRRMLRMSRPQEKSVEVWL